MNTIKRYRAWLYLVLPVIVFLFNPSVDMAWRMANGACNALFGWFLAYGAFLFYVWQRRYRAGRSLERKGLLYLAIVQEKLGGK